MRVGGMSQSGTSLQAAQILSIWLAQVSNRRSIWQSGYKSHLSMDLSPCQWTFIALNPLLSTEGKHLTAWLYVSGKLISLTKFEEGSTSLFNCLFLSSSGNMLGDEDWQNSLSWPLGESMMWMGKRRTSIRTPRQIILGTVTLLVAHSDLACLQSWAAAKPQVKLEGTVFLELQPPASRGQLNNKQGNFLWSKESNWGHQCIFLLGFPQCCKCFSNFTFSTVKMWLFVFRAVWRNSNGFVAGVVILTDFFFFLIIYKQLCNYRRVWPENIQSTLHWGCLFKYCLWNVYRKKRGKVFLRANPAPFHDFFSTYFSFAA